MAESCAQWFVYMVLCANETLYTGTTTDIERRLRQHNTGKGASYTRSFGPVRLVWSEPQPTRAAALRRECQIKQFDRTGKARLAGIIKE